MISKHVQEILSALSGAESVSAVLMERSKKPNQIFITSSNYSPLTYSDPVMQLSNGKIILTQDLEFADINDKSIKLGNYEFFLN
jgi:hypothetical protein